MTSSKLTHFFNLGQLEAGYLRWSHRRGLTHRCQWISVFSLHGSRPQHRRVPTFPKQGRPACLCRPLLIGNITLLVSAPSVLVQLKQKSVPNIFFRLLSFLNKQKLIFPRTDKKVSSRANLHDWPKFAPVWFWWTMNQFFELVVKEQCFEFKQGSWIFKQLKHEALDFLDFVL